MGTKIRKFTNESGFPVGSAYPRAKLTRINIEGIFIPTRMHFSRMRTVRCSDRNGGGCVYPSMHWVGRGCLPLCMLGYIPTCGQNSSHTLVKTLPFRNYVADSNNVTQFSGKSPMKIKNGSERRWSARGWGHT